MWHPLSESSIKPKSTTFFSDKEFVDVGPDDLVFLENAAAADPSKRARLCLHSTHSDPVQQMIIAFTRGSYIRPHGKTHRSKSYHCVTGEFWIVFFDDAGRVVRCVPMGPPGSERPLVYRFCDRTWHTILVLSEVVIIHEISAGPFLPGQAQFPAWSPHEADHVGCQEFLVHLADLTR